MASASTLFAYFFALVGIILLASIGYYAYLNYYTGKQDSQRQNWPPSSFMRNVGSKCPTGWTFIGTDPAKGDVCVNDLDVKTGPAQMCYDDPSTKTKSFSTLSGWPISPSAAQKTLADRCAFVKSCGPSSGKYATWFGIADLC